MVTGNPIHDMLLGTCHTKILLDLVLLSVVHLVARVGVQSAGTSTEPVALRSMQPPVAGLSRK